MRLLRAIAAVALATAASACDNGPKFGAPAKLTKVGDGQASQAGSAVPTAPAIIVTDDQDRGVPGLTVNFSVTTGNGSVQTATTTTDKGGMASSGGWTLGTLAGEQSMRAHGASLPGVGTFTASATSGPTATLTKVAAEPALSPAGSSIDSIVVLAADQFGNPVAGEVINFAVTAGGGSVSPTTRTTLADGRAAARWTLGTTVEQTNTATASRANGAVTLTFSTVTSRPVATIRFGQRVLVVDSSQTITPTMFFLDGSGGAVAGAQAALSTRNVSIATAGSTTATGARSGQTFLIATSVDNPVARDSALLVVSGAGKPAVIMSFPRFDLKTDTTFTVSLIVDSRSTTVPIGAATLQVAWPTTALTFVSEEAGAASASVDVNTSAAASGVLSIAMASATGLTGPSEIRRLTFKASATAGRTGTVSVDVVDMAAAATFVNLAAQTVSGSYPLRIR